MVVEGSAAVEIPTTLKAGDKIYSDGKKVYVCDEYWKAKADYLLPETALWNGGDNIVKIECDFSSEKAPIVEFEFKAIGNEETIGI